MARPVDAEALEKKISEWLGQPGNGDYYSGYDAALCAVQDLIADTPTLTPPNEWVSVEDAVPDPGVRVLAANGSFVGEAYMASNGAWMRHDGFPWNVDCWMPMPDSRPPEGEA